MTHERPIVGLIVSTYNNAQFMAHLQMRGIYNYRKMVNQTWPGIHQATAEGKKQIKKGLIENDIEALQRELHEEIGFGQGELMFKLLLAQQDNVWKSVLVKKEHITIFWLHAAIELLTDRSMRPENITGGFRPVNRHDLPKLIVAKPEWRKTIHPYSLNDIVVKPHVKEALEILFIKVHPTDRLTGKK